MGRVYVYSPADEPLEFPVLGHLYTFAPNALTELTGSAGASADDELVWLLKNHGDAIGFRTWLPPVEVMNAKGETVVDPRDGDPDEFKYDEGHPVVKAAEEIHEKRVRAEVASVLSAYFKREREAKAAGLLSPTMTEREAAAQAKAREWGLSA